jgi:hypothetical protein
MKIYTFFVTIAFFVSFQFKVFSQQFSPKDLATAETNSMQLILDLDSVQYETVMKTNLKFQSALDSLHKTHPSRKTVEVDSKKINNDKDKELIMILGNQQYKDYQKGVLMTKERWERMKSKW